MRRVAAVTQFRNASLVKALASVSHVFKRTDFNCKAQRKKNRNLEALKTRVYTTGPPEFKTAIAILKRTTGLLIRSFRYRTLRLMSWSRSWGTWWISGDQRNTVSRIAVRATSKL